MKDIECPKCHTTFQVDDSTYESIVAHVRNKTFQQELDRRMAEAEEQFKAREESVKLRAGMEYEKQLANRNSELGKLRNEITRLSGVISGYDASKQSEMARLESDKAQELLKAVSEKEQRITELKAQILDKDREIQIQLLEEKNAGQKVLEQKDREITKLQAQLDTDKASAEKHEAELRELHKQQLRDKQDEIDRLKDYRMRLSTKMVGENLEQHCSILFEQARSMGLYPDAYFSKDNEVVENSKGDFIFRDYVEGQEYVSIMFEMKNEMDTTATKHKNDDFLDKLDKDRTRKNCEYAVLVSMLEQDSELYNTGIVDKSHRYPKMIVIRPQFFMPVLRLITEGARKGFMDRRMLVQELEAAKSQSLDLSKFEERISKFREGFDRNLAAAHSKFEAATKGIDKTIEALEKQIKALRDIKANFEASEMKLLKASEDAEEKLTVKKLTHGIPAVRKMIEEAK